MIVYLSIDQVLALHKALVRQFGGSHGVRDRGALEAAVARPQMTFGGEDLYADVPAKSAALMHSLVMNHPFIDGNKRVGAATAELFLNLNGCELLAADDDWIRIAFETAEGRVSAEELAIWIRQRSREVDV